MARLRMHETFGNSVNCKTLAPFEEVSTGEDGSKIFTNKGPTFTIHIFDTKAVSENGSKICAFEVWQRDLDKKRTLVASGEGLEYADPASDEAMLSLTQAILTQEQARDFHVQYAQILHDEAKERFTPRVIKKRVRKTAEVAASPVEVGPTIEVEAEVAAAPDTTLAIDEPPTVEVVLVEPTRADPSPKIHVHVDFTLTAHQAHA